MNKRKLFASVCALSLFVSPINALALTKDETVYSNLNAYGEVKKTTVSNHLSYIGSNDIQDETYLKEILNVNGDEEFSLSNTRLTWKNQGNDIYYQGTTDKEMPIKANIRYYLDGKETTVNEMIGKSGKIKINIQLTNTEENKVKVNGKTTTLYTPYVSTIGLVLDENAKNISVSNGKVVSTGTKSVVAGIAAPGLYDSLKLDELDDLDRVTINYTTSNFQFSNMYIVSTPKLLQEIDTEIFDKLDKLTDSIDQLQKNMDKIEDGSNKVAKGSQTLESTVKKSIQNGLDSQTKKSIQKQAKATVSSQFTSDKKEQTISNAWASTKEQLDNSTDTTVTTYVTEEVVSILAAYINTLGFDAPTSASLAQAFALYTTIDPVTGPATEQQVQAYTAVTTYFTAAQIDTLKVFATSVKTSAATAAKKSTYYIAEKVSKGAASSGFDTAKQTAETVAETVAGTVAESTYETVLKTLYGDDKHAGIKALNDGIQTLNAGIEEYNDKGICVLSKYAKKIDDYSSKAEALVNLSKKYDGYGSDNADNTTFISIVKNK